MALLIVLYGLLPGLQVAYFLLAQPFLEGPDTVNFIASILCFQWMLANVLVASKIPAFQRYLPYDARIRFHLWGTLGITLTLIYHGAYKLIIGKQIDWISWTMMGLFGALILIGCLWIPLPGIKHFRISMLRWVRHGIHHSYDILKSLHNWIFLALSVLMYFHVLAASMFTQIDPLSAWIYNVQLVLTAAVFLWARLRNFLLPVGTLLSAELAGGIWQLTFETARPLPFAAGQFTFLRFQRRELAGETHPFSFLNAPGSRQVSFGIRALGDFTRSLNQLRPGDRVRIGGGFGNFQPRDRDRELCLIASGIGSVPCLSILEDLAGRQDRRPIQFILAVGKRDEIPQRADFEALKRQLPGLDLHILVSEAGDPLFSTDYFRQTLRAPDRQSFYLCSSPAVRRIVEGALKDLGVRRSQVHYEAFNLG